MVLSRKNQHARYQSLRPWGSRRVFDIRAKGVPENEARRDTWFRWSQGQFTNLRAIDIGGITSASAVTGDGSLIVGSSISSGVTSSVVWDVLGNPTSLESLLGTRYGLDYEGYDLGLATAVSPDGTRFAGVGTDLTTGLEIAWMATIPEPASVTLFGLGLVLLASGEGAGVCPISDS